MIGFFKKLIKKEQKRVITAVKTLDKGKKI